MPVTPTYPGVYIQEVPSGVRTVVGVSTSIALFIGRTRQGPLSRPIRCLNYTDFVRNFSEDTSVGDMARYVRLFFLNGGTDCYVMRIASGATPAEVTLQNEARDDVLKLTAKQAGVIGETIRAEVTYAGPHPEANFNIKLFRWETDSAGRRVQRDVEEWRNLSMDPNSSLYAPDFITQESRLVNAEAATDIPDPEPGFSQSGRPVSYQSGDHANTFVEAWEALIGTDGSANCFEISVDGSRFVHVDLRDIAVRESLDETSLEDTRDALGLRIQDVIQGRFGDEGMPGITVAVGFVDGPRAHSDAPAGHDVTSLLRISSENQGDVFIRPARADDAAVPLMLGSEQGGLEVGAHAMRRPAPNGISLRVCLELDSVTHETVLSRLAGLDQSNVEDGVLIDGELISPGVPLVTRDGDDPLYYDDLPASRNENNDGVRQKLGFIRDAINDHREANPTTFFWRAELWGSRLAILPTSGDDNHIGTFETSPTDLETEEPGSTTQNVRHYSVGIGGIAGFQTLGVAGLDGDAPQSSDYDAAYDVIEREVDLFNLLILPPDREPAVPMTTLWGPASAFCQQRRALLLMDAPTEWGGDAQTASTGVVGLRAGLVKDHSAIFYPRLVMRDDGLEVRVGPTGAIAGLMARIDSARGVWKAPAGTEADLRGIVGLEHRFSDGENGTLNPRAINTLRVFPNGIVNWGARTMDGDDDFPSDWKYIPVRRLALFIEESLYRGLKWVVFEPNDEPLWSQIRLNVGAFMQNLFRQGAFQGQRPSDAYFVKCDAETTTQNDRNLGIVNIWVGFAPLKPAEFVILYIQQMAGQIEV